MAQLGTKITRSELPVDESSGSYELLPDGLYDVKVTDAGLKDTKSGTGQYIKLELTIIGEKHSGRKLWSNLNIRNDSEKAEEIGRKQLNSLMAAIGKEELEDTDELVGGDLSVKVGTRPASGGYDAQNEVKAYKAMAGGSASASATKTEGKAKPPWGK